MLTHPQIDPVILPIWGSIAIRWYGLMYFIGFLCAYFNCRLRAKRFTPAFSLDEIDNLIFYFAAGIVLGGRIGYVLFYNSSIWVQAPLEVFKLWAPGRSFHGGLLGALLAFCCFSYRYKRNLLQVADFAVPAVPLGLAFGRIGNFINGELWGRVSDAPWAMVFPHAGIEPRHPSQLYECVLEGLLLFLVLHFWGQKKTRPGQTTGVFLLGYGILRFLVEYLREPDFGVSLFGLDWLTMGQWLSLPMIAVGVLFIYHPWYSLNGGRHETVS